MPRDVQYLLLFFAVLAGIGAYVLTDGHDLQVMTGQSAIQFPSRAPVADPMEEPTSGPKTVAGGRCVEMRFYDDKGVILPVDPPLIGVIIGDGPLFEGSPPPFAKAEAGRVMPCPQDLIASVQKTFDDFCASDDRRRRAASDNGVDIGLVNKRCADMTDVLAK